MKGFDLSTGKYLDNREYYKEIGKLHDMFENDGLPVRITNLMDGYQLTIDGFDFDVIEHYGSYGCNDDKLEIMGLYSAEECGGHKYKIKGHLTADEIYKKFYEVYPK